MNALLWYDLKVRRIRRGRGGGGGITLINSCEFNTKCLVVFLNKMKFKRSEIRLFSSVVLIHLLNLDKMLYDIKMLMDFIVFKQLFKCCQGIMRNSKFRLIYWLFNCFFFQFRKWFFSCMKRHFIGGKFHQWEIYIASIRWFITKRVNKFEVLLHYQAIVRLSICACIDDKKILASEKICEQISWTHCMMTRWDTFWANANGLTIEIWI